MTSTGVGLNVYVTSSIPPVGGEVELAGPEARHAGTVRRERPGAHVLLTDGRGSWARCRVTAAGRDSVRVEALAVGHDSPGHPHITLAQALVKDDRLAVDLLTQAGVDRIVPWAADRGVARPGARGGPEARWLRWSVEAAKQARRSWHPEVSPVVGLDGVCRLAADAELAIICHEGASVAAPDIITSREVPATVLIVVGPEGGLTPEELRALAAAGGHVVGLGPTVMRAAVAGAMAAVWAASSMGRWSGTGAAGLP